MSLDHAVLGFRLWPVTKDGLGAATGRAPWVPGVNTASCEHSRGRKEVREPIYHSLLEKGIPPHSAPGVECGCGLYAWHTLDSLKNYEEQLSTLIRGGGRGDLSIYGAVAGWGRTIAHKSGWRAEKARVLAFAVREDTDFVRGLGSLLADMYGVPLVPFDMLQLEGARHAGAIPNKLLPKPEPAPPIDYSGWFLQPPGSGFAVVPLKKASKSKREQNSELEKLGRAKLDNLAKRNDENWQRYRLMQERENRKRRARRS